MGTLLTIKAICRREILTLCSLVPRRFVELLDLHEPIALALWIRSVVVLELFGGTSGSWWIQGSGHCKVAQRAMLEVQRLMPTEMLWAMEWPQKIISREISLDPGPNNFPQ